MANADRNAFINNADLTEETSLTHLLDVIAPDIENETQLIDHSKYYDDRGFSDVLKHSNNKLSMISLNCQSINAKFDKLKLFVTEMNTHETISVICIQEAWGHNGKDMDSFSLPNYSLVNENRRLSNHGGLIIYVHDNFSFKVLNKDMHITHTSKLFESLIVEIWRNNCKYQKYIIGSVYRLPSYVNIDIEIFTEEYTELLNNLRSRSKFVYLCGDYNIDLLKISTNNVFNKFYENITSCGFIPKITLPTRICDTTSTLIDNVYTNAIDKSHICGILIHPISDHQMYFCVLDETYQRLNNKPKYIEFEKLNETSMIEFKHEIENADLNRKLNHELSADPNLNYEILAKVLQSAKTKHIPKVTKKFNKRKHKRE